MTETIPKMPTGTGPAGRRLWRAVLERYELDEQDRAVLVEAVRTVDQLEDLAAAVRRDGVLVESPQGRKAHPALVEARQQRLVLAKLIAALGLPADEADAAADRADRSASARAAARARWGNPSPNIGA